MICTFYESDSLPKSIRIIGPKRERRPWSSLPLDLVLLIADNLFLKDLVNFGVVCKGWSDAMKSPATIDNLHRRKPWFLVYGQGSRCLLLSTSGKQFTMDIPELRGMTCLASNHGWLLLFRNGFFFFFNLLSREKIRLPIFPHEKLTDHVAAFSSPPPAADCTVCVVTRSSYSKLSLYLLSRRDMYWTKHNVHLPRNYINTIKSAWFRHDMFYFFDNDGSAFAFSVTFGQWCLQWSDPERQSLPVIALKLPFNVRRAPVLVVTLPFTFGITHLKRYNLKKQFGLTEDVSISTCGTMEGGDSSMVILNEKFKAVDKDDQKYQLQGVWIRPMTV